MGIFAKGIVTGWPGLQARCAQHIEPGLLTACERACCEIGEIELEIPAAWWEKAGATDFTPSSEAYAYTPDPRWETIIVPISEIEEPKRDPGVVELHEDRSLALLRAFVAECPMPPIAVSKLPEHNLRRYKVKDVYLPVSGLQHASCIDTAATF